MAKIAMLRQSLSRALMVSTLLVPAAAVAQTASGSAVETVVVTAYSNNLQLPSTTASRLDLPPLLTPASVAVISGDVVRDWGDANLLAAASRAPGVTPSATPGNGANSLVSRGFIGPNTVMQLYNGVMLDIGGQTTTFPKDTWNIDHVDVLTGPASVLYGAGSIGGAINNVSKQPDPTGYHSAAEVSAGSFNSFHEALSVTGPLSQRLSWRADVSHYSATGWTDRGQSHSIAISGALRYEASPNLIVTLSNDYGDENLSPYEGTPISPTTFRPAPGLERENFNPQNASIRNWTNLTMLREAWTVSDSVTVHNYSSLALHSRTFFDATTYTYNPVPQTVTISGFRQILPEYEPQYSDSGDVTVHSLLGSLKNEFVAGFDVNRTAYKRTASTNPTSGSFTGSATAPAFNFIPVLFSAGNPSPTREIHRSFLTQYGAFAEDRLSLTDQISLVGGVRYDTLDLERDDRILNTVFKQTYNAPSWHVGAVYNPQPMLSFYGQYSVAYDPPTALDNLSISQEGFVLSKGRGGEVGAKQSLMSGRFQWTFAAYTITKNNLATVDTSNPSGPQIQVGQQSARGLEASIALNLNDVLTIEANGSVLKAKFDSFTANVGGKPTSLAGYRPALVPNETGNLWLTWKVAPAWRARFGLQYVGDRFADNTNLVPVPGYTVSNLGLEWRISPGVRLDGRVNNLFNTVYAPYATTTQWLIGSPRSITATLDLAL